jgi:hypothetical protein
MPRGERSYHTEESQTERVPAVRLVTEITDKTEPNQIELSKAHIRNLDKQLEIRKKMIEDAKSEEAKTKAKERYDRQSQEREALFAQLPQMDQIAFLQEEEELEAERNKIIQIDDFREKKEIKPREPKKRFYAKIGIESPAALAKEEKQIVMKKVKPLPGYIDLTNLADNTYLTSDQISELSPAIDNDEDEEPDKIDKTKIINKPELPEKEEKGFSALPFDKKLLFFKENLIETDSFESLLPFLYKLEPSEVKNQIHLITEEYKAMLVKLLLVAEEQYNQKKLTQKQSKRLQDLREIIITYIPNSKPTIIRTGEFESLDNTYGDQNAPYADTYIPNRPAETYNYELDGRVKERYSKMSYDALISEKNQLNSDIKVLAEKIEEAKFIINKVTGRKRLKGRPDPSLGTLEGQKMQLTLRLTEVEKNLSKKKPQELKLIENPIEKNFFEEEADDGEQNEEELSLLVEGAEKTIARWPAKRNQTINERPLKQTGEKITAMDINKNPNIFIELQRQFQKNREDRSTLKLFNDKVIEVEKEIEKMQKQLQASGMEKFKRFFGLGSISQNEINEISDKIKLLSTMLAEAKTIRKNQFRD